MGGHEVSLSLCHILESGADEWSLQEVEAAKSDKSFDSRDFEREQWRDFFWTLIVDMSLQQTRHFLLALVELDMFAQSEVFSGQCLGAPDHRQQVASKQQ